MNRLSYALLTHAHTEAALQQDYDTEIVLLFVLSYAKQGRLGELVELLRQHAETSGIGNVLALTDLQVRREIVGELASA